MIKAHHYSSTLEWTGNLGTGTSQYKAYSRSHTIHCNGKPIIYGSSDPAFLGDASCYNPEELLLASLSACHMLWYLHLCADAAVQVLAYTDNAEATMQEDKEGGRFTQVRLYPSVQVAHHSMIETALQLHHAAHQKCFIANSVNFPVNHLPKIWV